MRERAKCAGCGEKFILKKSLRDMSRTRVKGCWTTVTLLRLFCLFGDSTWVTADNSVQHRTLEHSFDHSSSSLLLNCPLVKSQESLDLGGIMGKWYVVEVLDHKIGPTTGEINTARVIIDSCPIIKLREDRGLLRLLWSEELGDLEYTFGVPDPVGAPGSWISTVPQNGTLTLKSYAQFTGSVYVMKAVGNHVLLTFCAANPDNQLYSVLMSREHILQRSNINGVHNLLSRRHLGIGSIRETCAKGRASFIINLPSSVATLILLAAALVASSSAAP